MEKSIIKLLKAIAECFLSAAQEMEDQTEVAGPTPKAGRAKPASKASKAKPKAKAKVEEADDFSDDFSEEGEEGEEVEEAEDFEEDGGEEFGEEEEAPKINDKCLGQLKNALRTYQAKKGRPATIKILNKFAQASADVKADDFAKIMKLLKV